MVRIIYKNLFVLCKGRWGRLLYSLLLLLYGAVSYAQYGSVSGTVVSAEDNLPIPGVNVVIKGTFIGTTTDFDGNFTLELQSTSDVLVFSYIGYAAQEYKAVAGDVLSVVLTPDAQQIDDVVVTALGIKRQERAIGYSTEKIEAKMVERAGESNIISAMTGRAAGVHIANGDGVDGGSTRITIRGNVNFSGGNQPLIVIDGVQIQNTAGLEDIGRGQDWGNALSNINPQDIETFNILKGGTASALYGSRGAAGVIEITTKKGRVQKGLGVSYNVSYKIKKPYRFRAVQNKYGGGGPVSLSGTPFPMQGDTLEMYPGISSNYSTDNLLMPDGSMSNSQEQFGYYGEAVSWGPEMDGREVLWWDGEMRPFSPQANNLEMFFNDGYTITHNVAASGGNEKGTMRLSVTRLDHKPIIDNSEYSQTTINLGSQLKISDRVRVDVNASYMDYDRLNSPILGEDANSFNKGMLYSWPRSYKGIEMNNYQNSDGTANVDLLNYVPSQYVDDYLWWNYYNHNTTLDRNKFLGSVTLNYEINDWLHFMGRSGIDFNLDQYEYKYKPIDALGVQKGFYGSTLNRFRSMNHDFMFIASRENLFDSKINAELSVGGARWDQNGYNLLGESGEYWYYSNYYSLQNYTAYTFNEDGTVDEEGAYPVVRSELQNRRTNSLYSFLNLSYKNYLFLQFTGRNDWSSVLDNNNNSFFYPSATVSFVLTEAFDLKNDVINFWKVRGGAAQTATDGSPYQTHFYYNTMLFGGVQMSQLPDTIPPASLAPQDVNSYEVGTTIGFFDSRIELDVTSYYAYSKKQILDLPIPVSSGSNFLKINEGEISNRGVEIILNTVPYNKGDWTVQSSINYTKNKNIVESLGDYATEYPLADIWGDNGPAMILREGDEYGTISGYDFIYDEEGNRVLNDEGTKYLITDQRVPIGNASPKFLAGWHNSVRYKNFTLSALVDMKWGGDIYCGSYVIGLQTGQSPETLLERDGGGLEYTDPEGNTSNIGVILPGVHEDGSKNETVVHYYYKYMPNAGGWGKFPSKPGIVENSWIKMREVSLSYQLPQNIVDRLGVFQNLSLSVTGRNLFYIYTTLPDNINPEGIMGSGDAQGFEWASYPSSRSFIFSLSANF